MYLFIHDNKPQSIHFSPEIGRLFALFCLCRQSCREHPYLTFISFMHEFESLWVDTWKMDRVQSLGGQLLLGIVRSLSKWLCSFVYPPSMRAFLPLSSPVLGIIWFLLWLAWVLYDTKVLLQFLFPWWLLRLSTVSFISVCHSDFFLSELLIPTMESLPRFLIDLEECFFSFFKYFLFFFNMKFIVTLVSIQHPVLIPTGALLNARHPLSPPSHPLHHPSVYSHFLSLLWFASLPLFFFPLPLPLPHGLLLSFSGSM